MEPREYILEDCPEYLFRLVFENFDGLEVPFIHVDFRKWSPATFKKALFTWKLFRATVRGPFFGVANHDNEKIHEKFVKKFGFTEFKPIPCPDGKTRTCYVSWDYE